MAMHTTEHETALIQQLAFRPAAHRAVPWTRPLLLTLRRGVTWVQIGWHECTNQIREYSNHEFTDVSHNLLPTRVGFEFHVGGGSAFATTCATAWSAATVYTAGGQSSENSVNYQANWWTRATIPRPIMAARAAASHGHRWAPVSGSGTGGGGGGAVEEGAAGNGRAGSSSVRTRTSRSV